MLKVIDNGLTSCFPILEIIKSLCLFIVVRSNGSLALVVFQNNAPECSKQVPFFSCLTVNPHPDFCRSCIAADANGRGCIIHPLTSAPRIAHLPCVCIAPVESSITRCRRRHRRAHLPTYTMASSPLTTSRWLEASSYGRPKLF